MSKPVSPFTDRVAIVTEAGSGIGRATAAAFAAAWARVFGVGRRQDALDKTAQKHPGIVNALAPGPTESEALTAAGLPESTVNQIKQREANRIPLGRRGEPDEVAAWVLHLADPATTWLTGQILTIDGGLELT